MRHMGLIFQATKESLHVITIIVIISFILVLCVLIILTLTAALAKISAGCPLFCKNIWQKYSLFCNDT